MESLGFYVDLHMHSYWSPDGFASPRQLLSRARSLGLCLLAITEHDNIDSWEEIRSLQQGTSSPPHIVPGIELTACWRRITIGVLGIGVDPDHTKMNSFLSIVSQEDMGFLDRWYKAAYQMGLGAIRDVVDSWIVEMFPEFPERRHRCVPEWVLTRLLWQSGLVSDRYVAEDINSSILERARHPTVPGVAKAIQLVHEAEGIAILEHPHADLSIETVEELMSEGFDGIELYHPGVDTFLRRSILAIAGHKGWLVSAGSDHHGTRSGWGREGQLAPHPRKVFELLAERMLDTASRGLP